MRRIGLIVLLLLFMLPLSANATSEYFNSPCENKDCSTQFLGKLFGQMNGLFADASEDSGGLMSALFEIYNKAIMVVAVLWLIYTISQVLLITATSDGPQKSIKNWLLWFRVLMGFALLVPGTNGYNLAQRIIMQVVEQGISYANDAWSAALTYLQDKPFFVVPLNYSAAGYVPSIGNGSIAAATYSTYIGNDSNSSSDDAVTPTPNSSSFVYQAYESAMCTKLSNYTAFTSKYTPIEVSPEFYTASDGTPTLVLRSGAVYFPGYGDSNSNAPSYNPGSTSISEPSDNCGVVGIKQTSPWDSDSSDTDASARMTVAQSNAEIAYTGLTLALTYVNTAADDVYSYFDNPDVGATSSACQDNLGVDTSSWDSFWSTLWTSATTALTTCSFDAISANTGAMGVSPLSTSDAQNLAQAAYTYLSAVADLDSTASASSTVTDFIAVAESQGWFSAGGFFWDLTRLQNVTSTMDSTATAFQPGRVAIDSSISKSGLLVETYLNQVRSALQTSVTYTPTSTSSSTSESVNTWYVMQDYFAELTRNGINSTLNDSPLGSPLSTNISLAGLDYGIMSTALSQLLNLISALITSNTEYVYNPILISYTIGKYCLGQAGLIWENAIGWIVAAAVTAALICCSDLFNAILATILPWLIITSGMLFSAGSMMVFYVPMYPYLLFLFGVVSWVISIVEAMAAAPLVAFGITHPEGHDFMGRSEQALMLALSVFLRPVLMIIGFLAGTTLMYIFAQFLNGLMSRVFVSAFQPGLVSDFSGASGSSNALQGIWAVLMNSNTTSGTLSGSFTGSYMADAFCIPIFLALYAFIVLEVTNQSFSTIHEVPDMVLRWIGGPVMQDKTEGMAASVKSGVGQAAAKAGEGMSQGGQAGAKFGDVGAVATAKVGEIAKTAAG